ncbi:DUF4419 domain-containing protein [Maribellus sp. YY47]|uniref:DUF4419 domain-containing protein n=1 Tax=Maribellus sp. YY47 TaxID=2929486 RepID=UPI0020010EAF|nr:DUF4419 domain-containing protein [Maribellus sp. YY47]MCK3684309.1 DUF4419 domain-containing protein [Maribellus sp. YY47]
MNKFFNLLILLGITVNVFGQHEIKFQVEELSKPEKQLFLTDYDKVYKHLILSDLSMNLFQVEKDRIDFPYNIVTKSMAPYHLVTMGYHSFFNGMYRAYADHRPFVLSPDMIWLLISQGFARHVSANPELFREKFLDFDGKASLVVKSNKDLLDSSVNPKDWENVFPQFTSQIANYTGEQLVHTLSSDFSTTTAIEKVASEITIMEAMEPFFEFVVFRIVCGIPEITLKGTPEDWQKVYDKAKNLGEYDLEWWTNELEPILEEFIKTSKGDIDKDFWRNMFKSHSQKIYGAPDKIDGWVVKFFPYNKEGKRNNLQELIGSDNLPEEIVKVDLQCLEVFGDVTKTTPLELWAGFIGLEQDSSDFTLTPKIGWMIRKKDTDNIGLKYRFKKEADSGISIRVKEIPEAIYALEEINLLEVSFIDSILVPDKLKEITIDKLKLTGKIDKSEFERISKMFPNTELTITQKKATKDTKLKSGEIDKLEIEPIGNKSKDTELIKGKIIFQY